MNNYLLKQFWRNKAYILSLLLLFFAGIMAIYTGKKFLDKNQDIIAKSASYQKQSIEKTVKYHSDDLGLILYYLKFNLVNETPRLSALNIGLRDINPSIQGVTIRNLEEQRYNSDFYNPANAAAGNFDLSFVLVFLFPLIIIAFCFNLISEEEESGRWKLLSVQSKDLGKLIDAKMLIRFIAITTVYLLLLIIAKVWVNIPIDGNFLAFAALSWLYFSFWFALCRWIISFRKSSGVNALILLVVWVGMNFIVPMSSNIIIQKNYPVNESLEAVMEQREGYHTKWDEAKKPTMDRFYKVYPQYKNYKVEETASSSWVWYYAMQHMGDLESSRSSVNYRQKMKMRNEAATVLGYILPNIQLQMATSALAKTGMENHLEFAEGLKTFHEKKRLSFYTPIFSGASSQTIDWNALKVEYFETSERMDLLKMFLPIISLIFLLLILSQVKYRKLC